MFCPKCATPMPTPAARVVVFSAETLGELARDGLRHEADVRAARAAEFSVVGVLRPAPRTKHLLQTPKSNDERGMMGDE